MQYIIHRKTMESDKGMRKEFRTLVNHGGGGSEKSGVVCCARGVCFIITFYNLHVHYVCSFVSSKLLINCLVSSTVNVSSKRMKLTGEISCGSTIQLGLCLWFLSHSS
jgi:hypothetical protein